MRVFVLYVSGTGFPNFIFDKLSKMKLGKPGHKQPNVVTYIYNQKRTYFHSVKYLGQRSFHSKVIGWRQTHSQTHAHTGPIALP